MASRLFHLLEESTDSFEDEDVNVHISAKINWVDYTAIAIYFLAVIIVGIWTTWKSKKDTVDNYFLAGRTMHWLPVGASLFASNVGSEHFVGLSGSGASVGIGNAGFEYSAMFVLLFLGWLFMPVYMASNISTMPEYLQKRFGGQRIRVYLSILALLLYIFTKISACLFAGSLFIKLLLNLDNIYIAILILLFVSAVFTILGGLTTVIWTDFVQVIFMLVGAIALAIISMIKVGGYHTLTSTFPTAGLPNDTKYQSYKNGCDPTLEANNNSCISCSAITPYYMNLFRPAGDSELPWPGIIGMFISAVWYWCTDQVIVQRGLSAKNLTHAKVGCVFASLLKISPMFLLIVPGMAARVLWPNQIGCSNPEYCKKVCGSPSGCTNLAYPYLVIRLMPPGATGLMVSVIVAALMSSLSSIFNSASTVFIIDIYNRFRKSASEVEQVIVGRFFIIFLVVISVVWIPIIESSQNSELFQYIQSVTSFLSPPVCAVYVLALFWNRTTEQGAFWSLVVGLIIGLVRMALEFAIAAPACSSTEPDPRPTFVSKIHYLHFGIILFVISILITVVISLFTKKPDEKQLYRLTFSTRYSEEVRQELDSNENLSEAKQSSSDSTGGVNKWISLICCAKPSNEETGGENGPNSYNFEKELTPEELARIHAQLAKDDPKWAYAANISAVVAIMVTSFFWGYYA